MCVGVCVAHMHACMCGEWHMFMCVCGEWHMFMSVCVLGVGEMANWIKSLSCKCENFLSNSQNQCKAGHRSVCPLHFQCSHSKMGGTGKRMLESLQARQHRGKQGKQRSCPKRSERQEPTFKITSDLHIGTVAQVHLYSYTQIYKKCAHPCTHTYKYSYIHISTYTHT